jgi:hypothetical protein
MPLGVKFYVRPSILLNGRDCSPLRECSPLEDKFHPWGPGVKLRMALRRSKSSAILATRSPALLHPSAVQPLEKYFPRSPDPGIPGLSSSVIGQAVDDVDLHHVGWVAFVRVVVVEVLVENTARFNRAGIVDLGPIA